MPVAFKRLKPYRSLSTKVEFNTLFYMEESPIKIMIEYWVVNIETLGSTGLGLMSLLGCQSGTQNQVYFAFSSSTFPACDDFQYSYGVRFHILHGSHWVFGYPNNPVSKRYSVPIDSDKQRSTVCVYPLKTYYVEEIYAH
ncbi:hypothetical protein TNCV_4926911 [Trichonephila clavipes]|nr:hypothetical protein TNCV_4926911 [Trichonephila clavipes]